MAITIISFGQLAEITGKDFQLEATDTAGLSAMLTQKYTALKDIKYLIAVNRKLVTRNTQLLSSDTVALLPPYSGG